MIRWTANDVPLGGASFAVEVLLGEVTFSAVLPAFATSAIAAFAARLVVLVDTLYNAPHMTVSSSLLVWPILAGPVLGFAAVAFARCSARAASIAPRGRSLLVVLPAVFAAAGLVAIVFPEILGNGRALGLAAMNEQLSAPGAGTGQLTPSTCHQVPGCQVRPAHMSRAGANGSFSWRGPSCVKTAAVRPPGS